MNFTVYVTKCHFLCCRNEISFSLSEKWNAVFSVGAEKNWIPFSLLEKRNAILSIFSVWKSYWRSSFDPDFETYCGSSFLCSRMWIGLRLISSLPSQVTYACEQRKVLGQSVISLRGAYAWSRYLNINITGTQLSPIAIKPATCVAVGKVSCNIFFATNVRHTLHKSTA